MDWEVLGLTTLQALLTIVVVMTIAGYSVVAERKISSLVQGRQGPNRTTLPLIGSIPLIGPFLTRLGVFQLPADGLKFLLKEDPVPGHVNKFYYFLAPVMAFLPAMLTMLVIPYGQYNGSPIVLADLDVGLVFFLAISSLGVYGIILAGWSANSKYPFLGGIRSSAQLISYELAMGLSILPVLLWTGATVNLGHVVQMQSFWWTIILQPVSALIFLVALFAETNRLPFDMPESETDLVAGYNTEYGAFKFGLFFIGEYAHIAIGSALFTVLFLGGWQLPFGLPLPDGILGAALSIGVFLAKVFFLIFFFIWIRWTLPRFRYDQVMNLGWRLLLPLAVINLVVYAIAIAVWDTVIR